jgi:DNA-directed RNA polymerase subunit RPC12/RpoP
MKVATLFIGLISLLIANVNAYGGDSDADYHHEIPKSCEDLFKVDKCSDCQKEIWDSWENPTECGFNFRFYKKIIGNYLEEAKHSKIEPYELGPYNKAVKDICHEKFSCKYKDAEYSWRQVEKKCEKELHTKVDWSQNPKNIDLTVASAYGSVLFYYFGIPDHDATCVKNSDGNYCGIVVVKDFVDWVKDKIPDGKILMSYDHKFVYSISDGSRYKVPKELFTCSECGKKMIDQFKGWHEDHPLPDYLVKNIFGSWDELKDYYTCPHDSYKVKLRRALNGPSRRSDGSSGFAHFMGSTRYLF